MCSHSCPDYNLGYVWFTPHGEQPYEILLFRLRSSVKDNRKKVILVQKYEANL
jgi:hypothetical protein